jgi:hypothetical protein
MSEDNAIPGSEPVDGLAEGKWGPHRVLIVVEMNQASLRALAWGCGLVRSTRASLTIATFRQASFDGGPFGGSWMTVTNEGGPEGEVAEFNTEVERLIMGASSLRRYRLDCLNHREITRAAKRVAADLVVIGCGALPSWRPRLFGRYQVPLVVIP